MSRLMGSHSNSACLRLSRMISNVSARVQLRCRGAQPLCICGELLVESFDTVTQTASWLRCASTHQQMKTAGISLDSAVLLPKLTEERPRIRII